MFKIELTSLTDHETLKVVLGDGCLYADLYYYCLDNNFFKHDRSLTKGLLNFVSMVENWKLKIRSLKVNTSDVLPFDYSDQYIGFFIISRINDDDIDIRSAFTTEYVGPLVNPSELYLINFMDKRYESEDKKYRIPIPQLLEAIDSSMSTILSSFYKKNF